MLVSFLCSYASVEEMEQVKQRMLSRSRVVDGSSSESVEAQPNLTQIVGAGQVREYMETQLPDGSWGDLNYQDENRSAWSPQLHVFRLLAMAVAYKDKSTLFYNDKALSAQIHKGLKFWDDGGFVCLNWWFNEIGTPRITGILYLLMEDEMSTAEMANAIKYMNNAQIGLTGQNRAWLAENVLLRALLLKDVRLFVEARDCIVEELRISLDGEGVRPDMSFHQHGAQQQFGNYGLSYAITQSYWAQIFKGTKYALSEKQMAVLRGYLLDAMQWVYWKGYMDIGSCGRQVVADAQTKKMKSYATSLQCMIEADPGYAGEYKKAYDRNVPAATLTANTLTGYRFFNYSDYGIYRASLWSAGLKMSSNRTIGAEIVNTENLLGRYVGNGAVFYYNRGSEYENIFPVWDWAMLPGTTCFRTDSLFDGVIQYKYYNNQHDFVGGIQGSDAGVSAMVLSDLGLTARKSYFFTGEAVVCMGSGIRGDKEFEVVTTIEQKLLNGEVRTFSIPSGNSGEQRQVVCHDGMAYYVFGNPSVQMEMGEASGSWRRTAGHLDTATVAADVFKLWINHGTSPNGASYGYMVFPAVGKKDVRKMIERSNIKTLCLNEKAHAIRYGNVIMAVFFEPSWLQIPGGAALTADHPCIIMVKTDGEKQELFVCDPTQTEAEVIICLSESRKGDYCKYDKASGQTVITVPVAGLKGEAVRFSIQ